MNLRYGIRTFSLLLGIVIISCDFPYFPEPEEGLSEFNQDQQAGSDVVVMPINKNKQVCNPSIALDTTNFKGCMLWLNFGGVLNVTATSVMSGYSTTGSEDHDRLTVTDTANTVRWYIMKTSIPEGDDVNTQFQDPEWSAHPEYIVTLFGSVDFAEKWSIYAIHPLSNHSIKICDQKINETSTPHLWVSPSALHGSIIVNPVYDKTGLIDNKSILQFFGTDTVMLTYSKLENNILSIFYVNYTDSQPHPVKLNRPADKEKKYWNFESALISPDGKWVVYNAYSTSTDYHSYLQELTPTSKPILLKEGASDPHWWVNPVNKQLHIIYSEINGDNRVLIDLENPQLLETGETGKTFLQPITLFPGLPSKLAFSAGKSTLLANIPLKGGLSPDGRFLCTGYNYAYIVVLK